MMTYRTVKEAMETLLYDGSLGRFTVIGRQLQSKSAEEARNNLVQIYCSDGDFPKSAGRQRGPKEEDITINIDLTVSASAKGDISVLQSETSTPAQKAVAIAAIKDATQVADEQLDDLIEMVWLIITDARNYDLGLDKGTVSSAWTNSWKKDTVIEYGGLVVKTANIRYTCRVKEENRGDIGNNPDTVVFNTSLALGESEQQNIGVIVENDNT